MSVPFRAAILTTPAPALPADAGAVPERVEETIVEARTATEADSRLRMWINHHDERVPLALIDGTLATWIAHSDIWSLHLYARAMRDAERDGVCWTPLLDRMATTGVWPTRKGRVVLGGKVSVVSPVPVAQAIEPLRRWLREQTDGTAFAPLAVFQASAVRALVQSRLAVLPAVARYTGEYPTSRGESVPAEHRVQDASAKPGVADVIVPVTASAAAPAPGREPSAAATAAPSASAARAAHPAPPATAAPMLSSPPSMEMAPAMLASDAARATHAANAANAANAASAASAAAPVAYADIGPHGVARQAAADRPHAVATHAAATPAAATPAAATPAAATPAAATRAPAPAPEPRYTPEQVLGLITVASQATGRTEESQVRPEIRRAINTLIEYRALPSEKLYTLYSACRLVKTWVVRIVEHVSATIELWRAALRDNNWIEVRESIVKSAVARRDSVIRLILSRCGSSDVLCALCLDGDMPDVPQIARRVRTANPRGLLDALLTAARTTGLRLTASDLSPLVHHDDAEVRQRAMALLHLMVRPA